MKRLALLLCCLSSALLLAQNIWKDPGFEGSGTPTSLAHGGQKAFILKGTQNGGWACPHHTLIPIEPFALYRAKAWGRRDVSVNDPAHALFFYDWDSFGWSWMFNTQIPKQEGWHQLSVTFYSPTDKISFYPLAFGKSVIDAQSYLDDLEIVKVLSPEENIAQLKKANPDNRYANEALSRYYLQKKDYAALDAHDARMKDNWSKADLACLKVKNPDMAADRVKNTADMIRYEGLNTPEGAKRLKEIFTETLTLSESYQACTDALNAKGTNAESVRKALGVLVNTDTFKDGPAQIFPRGACNDALIKAIEKNGNKAYDKILAILREKNKELSLTIGDRRIVMGTTPLSPENFTIVIPADTTPTEKQAANELNYFLTRITGKSFDIITDKAPRPAHAILIGRNASIKDYGFTVDYKRLGLEGIHIEHKNGHLLLAGGKRGVLYAVYTFLEDRLGCRWFAVDCERIPSHGSTHLAEFQTVFVPALEYRDTDYPCCRPPVFGVRNKLNGLYSQANTQWGGHNTYGGFVHTMDSLIPPSVYGETHPEYYALRNGQRVTTQSQPCLTNPEVLAIAKAALRKRIQSAPQHTLFSVSQNDNQQYCQCPNCTALAEKEGSQMGPLLHFVNALAKDIAKDYPDKIIDTLAYQYTRKPPKYVKPEQNVVIRLCSIECCFSHPIEDDPANHSFTEDIRGWQKLSNRLHIWDYVINYRHCIMPFPNLRVLKPNIEFFLAHGVTGIYEEANYFSKGGEFSELRSYLLAKLLWDASTDVNNAIFEFTEAFYGPAGKYIRDYINLLHDEVCPKTNVHPKIFCSPSLYMNPKLMDKCEAIFQKASAAVKGKAPYEHRVNVAHLPVIYTRHELVSENYFQKGNLLVRNVIDNADIKLFAETAKKEGITKIREGNNIDSLNGWITLKQSAMNDVEILPLQSGKTKIEILPAIGGRVWKAVDLATGEELLQYFGNAKDGYQPEASAYEEYAYPSYRAEGWATPFTVQEKGTDYVILKGRMKDGTIATRRIQVLSDQSGFKVDTQYTAEKPLPARSCRLHPQFHVGNPKAAKILLKKNDGSFTTMDMAPSYGSSQSVEHEIWLQGNKRPNGEWKIVYPCKSGTATLTNTFDPSTVKDCYLHFSTTDQRINLEQWSTAVPLTPTSGPRFSNTYVFTVTK